MPNLSLLINNSSTVKNALVKAIVTKGTAPDRMPIIKTPLDYGMAFDSVDIEASDGIRLSAWLIRRDDTKKLAVVNHPLMCTRYGSIKGVDDVPVEFIPMLKHLHTAGYSILTYDQRGQGESDGGLGNKIKGTKECPVGAGAEEWKDVVGVAKYVKDNFPDHEVALMGQCMGANSIFKSFTKAPDAFAGVLLKCMVALQPTRSSKMRSRMTKSMVGVDLSKEAGELQQATFGFSGVDCVDHAPNLKVPILIAQVKEDVYAHDEKSSDVQDIFDACPTGVEKQLLWLGPGTELPFGSGLRFEGYNYFNYHPQPLIDFLNTHTGGCSVPPQTAVNVESKVGSLSLEENKSKDEDHPKCQLCATKFTLTKRRHHCRCCKRVLCGGCTPKKVDKKRACMGCWVHAEAEKMNESSGKAPETKFETSIEIEAPASVVWSTLTAFEKYSSWCTSVQSLEGDFKEGGHVILSFNFTGLNFKVPHVIRDFKAGEQWAWSDEVSHGITNNHLYRVEAIDETRSRFINNDELTGGNPVMRYGVLRNMREAYEEFNQQLKAAVEAESK